MNIKHYLLFLTILFNLSIDASAQFVNCKVADIKKLKSSELIVAISDDVENNKGVNDIMAANWTASKYKVIKVSELEAYLKTNPNNFVLTYLRNQRSRVIRRGPSDVERAMDKANYQAQGFSSTTASSLAASRTNSSYTKHYKDVLLLSSNLTSLDTVNTKRAMFKCFIDEELDTLDQTAELTRQIACMNHLFMVPNLKDDQLLFLKMMRNYPTADPKQVIKQELWIAESDIENNKAKMDKAYPFKYKVVSKKEIAEAIISKRKDVVYLAYIVASEKEENQPRLKLSKGERPPEGLYVIHNAEDNKILMLLSAVTKFGYRHLGAIKKAAEK